MIQHRVFSCFLLALLPLCFWGQEASHPSQNYKVDSQYVNFRRYRNIVAAWQIHQLKQGALVVRLQTGRKLAEALRQSGQLELMEEKQLEQRAINYNIYRCFTEHYRFSKLYFIYSDQSDSLLKGKRSHCFLDSTLKVDPSIEMKENFYLLAESDVLYNSSIGFVPESQARQVTEHGNPSHRVYQIVLKNKYGHQLKNPIPHSAGGGGLAPRVQYIKLDGVRIPFNIEKVKGEKVPYKGKDKFLYIPKNFSVPRYSLAVDNLEYDLDTFYRVTNKPDAERLDPAVRKFLY
jgi:hypothetical protein